ncbi:MAG: hypothetical protein FWC20_04570 [Oscillospiraceae bacterium]|nr:hypothetical protein [Oscillospiraceae bacterium]MCL2278667.1 hypothetical protein [Oscillospiraceae bacterium]
MHSNSRDFAPRANGFVSAVLGGLLFVLVCIFILLLAVDAINTAAFIQNTDVARVLVETGVSNELVDQLNRLPFIESRIDIYDVDEFIRNEVVAQEISRALGGYLAAFADGNLEHHITQGEVLRIARNLGPELGYMFDHEMTEADHERLARVLDEAVDFRGLTIGNLVDEVGVDLRIPQFAASGNLLILVGILCIVTLLLMILHHRRRFSDVFKNAGGPTLLAGLVCFLLGFILSSYTQMFGAVFYRISVLLSGPLSLIMTYSLYAIGTGIVMLIIHLVFRATRPSRR